MSLSLPVLIIIIVLSVLLVAGLGVLLYFTLIKRSLYKKQSKEIIGTFEREHAILFGDIQRNVTRLKSISELNLTYVDIYTKWQMKFKDIRDSSDANAQSVANSLKDALDARHWNELKTFLPKAKKEVDVYAQRVEELKNSLEEVFRVETETMTISFKEKDKCRAVKAKYYAEKDDLGLVSESMNSLFKMIDDQILKADEQKDKACYAEAQDIYLNHIDKTLEQIDALLNVLPKTCLELTSLLPDRILSLRNRYQNMTEKGYPLVQIVTFKTLDGFEDEIERMTQNIKVLNNTGVGRGIETMRNQIDAINEQFDKEEEARKIFEENFDRIYSQEEVIHQNFVDLSNSLDTIKTYYLLGADDISKFQEISDCIGNVSSSKTLLDNYVHSNSPQLYSVLVEKMNSLAEMVDKAKAALDDFENYLRSLKEISESSALLIKEYFKKSRDYESLLASLNSEILNKRYSQTFADVYGIIDELYEDLTKMPINVKKVQKEVEELKNKADSLYIELDSVNQYMHDAENSIMQANRYRLDDMATDQLVYQAEAMFQNASYKEAYNALKDVSKPTVSE